MKQLKKNILKNIPKDFIKYDCFVCKSQSLKGYKFSKLIKKGKSHPLGIAISSKTPAFPPRTLSLTVMAPNQNAGADLKGALGYHMTYADDILNTWVGIGSQIDGLGHLGENNMLYNCNKAGDVIKITGLTKLGVDKIPPMIARAVLIDMTKHFGVEHMEAGQAIIDIG